jgi:hypothetical protein
MPDSLVTIVYFSHASREYDHSALLDLLTLSRRNNRRDDITGMLLHHDGNFVQALEGPPDSVARTFARIGADSGHDGIISTGTIPVQERQFPNWSMGFHAAESLPQNVRDSVSHFLGRGGDSGREMTKSVAWSLLKAFRAGLSGAS